MAGIENWDFFSEFPYSLIEQDIIQQHWRTQQISGGAPGRRRIFENFKKIFARKSQKINYFSLFFQKIQNYTLKFCVFGRKTQMGGKYLRKF